MSFVIEIQSEFDYIVRSFQFVAGMFSPGSSYMGLLFVLGTLGIFFGGIAAISATANGARSALQSWFLNMLIAASLIVVLLNDKSTITIHDTTTNQFRTIGGIPTVMGAIAFAENRVEGAVKDIISTIMSPILPYDDIGKGNGFELLASTNEMAQNYVNKFPHIKRSVGEYFDRCVLPDVTYGWTSLSAIHNTADIWASIKSDTKTYYSVVYTPTDQQGTPYNCSAAYTKIDAMMKTADIDATVTAQCQSKYSDPMAAATCRTNLDNLVQSFLSSPTHSINLNSYLRSYIVADAMKGNDGAVASMLTDLNKKNAASSFMAEKMVPRLKGMMYGMIIGIFPLLVGFIWFRPADTAIFYAGMFVLLVLWGAIDTFMDMQYQNEAFNMFRTMRDNGLGYQQMFDIPNKAADAVTLYGSGRWVALGLATAIAAAITKVNAHAISQMGSQLASSAQGAAAARAANMDSAGLSKLRQEAGLDFGQRELNDMTPVPNYNNLGTNHALNQAATMNKVDELNKTGFSMPNIAQGMGLQQAQSTAKGIASARAEDSYLGGMGGVMNQAANERLFGLGQMKSNIDKLSSTFGGVTQAGERTGANQAINTAENVATTDGRLQAAGSEDALFRQATQQGATHFQQTQGGLLATQNEANALGMDIAQATLLKQNGNILTPNMAQGLNEQYGTNAFKAGQQMSYGVKDGKLDNVMLRDNVNGAKVGGYSVSGTQETVLDDKMNPSNVSYRGLINNQEGSIMTDGSGNVINMTGVDGYQSTHNAIESVNQGTSYQGAMQAILADNSAAVNRLAHMQVQHDQGLLSKDKLEQEKLAFSAALASDISVFKSESVGEESRNALQLYARGEVNAGGNLGFIKATGSAGVEKNSVTSSSISEQRNPMVKDIYDSISNTNNDFNKMFPDKDGVMSNQEAQFKEEVLAKSLRENLNSYAQDKIAMESNIEIAPETPRKFDLTPPDPNIHKK